MTGGAGYIGSVVATQLLEAGHEAVVLGDLSTGHRDAVPAGAAFVQGRVHEAELALDASFDAVLHSAAKSRVGESVEFPGRYWGNDVVGSLLLLATMRESGVRRLVLSSSAATHGQPTSSPIAEDEPAVPINPYGQSKLAVDMALDGDAHAHGLAAVSLRYLNVGGAYGGHGERHDVETHLVPTVLAVAAGRRDAVTIFGTDHPTRDGTCVRDCLHVADLARAHLLALDGAVAGRHDGHDVPGRDVLVDGDVPTGGGPSSSTCGTVLSAGSYGARATGGGFDGSVLAPVDTATADDGAHRRS